MTANIHNMITSLHDSVTAINLRKLNLFGGSVKLLCTRNTLCNVSRKKSREVATSLPGRFLSRRCFTLCITKEVESRIATQYKCHHCCSCNNYRGKGMEGGGKKCLCVGFGWPEDREFVRKKKKKKLWGASYSTSNKLLIVARHILTTGLQKCL